jgi:hypothetical protein
MKQKTAQQSSLISWMFIFLILLWILGRGIFSFLIVGDNGQPTWDYRAIKDVPGESPYAVYTVLPHPQHVRGDKGE